jgi:hypothetical protein
VETEQPADALPVVGSKFAAKLANSCANLTRRGSPSGIIAVLRRRTEPPQRVDQFHCLPDAVEMPRQPPDQRAAGALQRLVVAVLADPAFG